MHVPKPPPPPPRIRTRHKHKETEQDRHVYHVPRITTRPPVMYSQPWSPTPSTTAKAPELRTQKRSPALPRKKAWCVWRGRLCGW